MVGLIGTIVLVLVLIFIGMFFINKYLLKGGGESLSQALSGTADQDKDGTINRLDKCLCMPGSELNDGCPLDVDVNKVDVATRYKKCPQEICDAYGVVGCPDNPQSK